MKQDAETSTALADFPWNIIERVVFISQRKYNCEKLNSNLNGNFVLK